MAETRLPIFFRYRIWWHVLFWAGIFLMYWITYGGYMDRYYEEFIISLSLLPSRLIGTYVFLYLVLPFVTKKKNFLVFGILVVCHAFFYGFIIWASYLFTNSYTGYYDFSHYSLFHVPKIFNKLVANYGIPVLAASIKIFKKWYIDDQKNKKLAEEKLAAELSFLKSQVHPHFLFNTLNNLYALTLIKSDRTPGVVLKLSDLLDYMIYKSNDDFVPLKKELEILEGYIELEKIRYNERLDLTYKIEGKVDGHQIAPLVLLPFIENSFKHGASNDRDKPNIQVYLKIGMDCLQLKVLNSIPKEKEEKKKDKSVSEGIGLKNVQRRLELIYPRQHELLIKAGKNQFEVDLKIFWRIT